MTNRPRFLALSISLLIVSVLSCTSHQRPVAQGKSKPATGGSGLAVAARPGVDSHPGAEVGRRAAAAEQAPTEQAADPTGPQVGYAVLFGHSVEARNLPPADGSGQAGEVNELNNEVDRPIAARPGFKSQDATIHAGTAGRPSSSIHGLSTSALASLPASTSFEGLADTDNGAGLVNPSDSNGAVGPNHYVEVVNNRVRVYTKAGVPLTAPFRQSSLFASLGGICSINDNGDPILLYDKLADRWQISQFAFKALDVPPYHQCIAESINGDPTGKYYLYDFVLPSNNFPDYPKLSTWPDAYYMSTRQFFLGGSFNGEGAIAFDRKKMLVGDPTATLIYFSESNGGNGLSFSSSGMLPTDFDGLLPPAPGTPNIFAIYTADVFGDPQGDALRLFDFHVDFVTPGSSTFTERSESPIAVAEFDPLNPSGRADIEQPPPALIEPSGPNPSDCLDTIGDRLMYRLQYRNRDGVESLVAVHTVNVGLHFEDHFPLRSEHQAAPRYYELRRSTPGGAFSIYDQATFSPDAGNPVSGLNRWMGSAAIDNQGNLVVGYSTSSPTVFPSVNFAARAFNDTGGLNLGEATIFAGLGSQIQSGNRWGDYSALELDPSDECTFYYVNEYYPVGDRNTNQFNWHTRVGSFKFDGCTPPARGKISGMVTDCVTGLPIVGAVVTASDGHSAATGADGTYSISVPPGSFTVGASDPFRNCNPSATQGVSVADGGTATADFCLTGNAKINLGAASFDDSAGNNNGIINRDECVKINAGLKNEGCLADSGISAVLSTSTAGVVVDQPLSSYPPMIVDAGGGNLTPYRIHTTPGFVCGTPIDFTLTVSSNHQPTHDLHFSFPTCAGGAPVPFSGSLASTDLHQTARMGRDGQPSACPAPKGCPGPLGAGPRLYDLIPFTNTGGSTACFTVNLTTACGNPIMAAAYLNSFNPANLCANYLGDPGGSPAPSNSFQVNVPAGQTLLLNIHEINPGLAGCSGYSGTVSGFFDNTDAGGHLDELSPAKVWVGLKNSDDVGTKFDLRAEVFENGSPVGSGETDNVSGGSSGFNNAILDTINLSLTGTTVLPGTLSIKLSVRVAATSGHSSGTARLWFNDSQADSRFDVSFCEVTTNLHLLDGFVLGTNPGPGPKKTIDVFVNRSGGNPWKPIGTWAKTF
jgi:hypothetical protein